jgi:hypothetical protein
VENSFTWPVVLFVVVLWLWAAGTLTRQRWPRFTAAVQIVVILLALVLMALWVIDGFSPKQ